MNRFILALIAALLPALAIAQTGSSVLQSGTVTPGHPVKWCASGVICDGGTASAGSLSTLGVTGSGNLICQNSGPITGAYNRLCLGVTATAGNIAMTNVGGATGGFTFTLNGSTQGIVTINLPTTLDANACFADTTGTLKNCSGGSNITGPGSSVDNAIVRWDGTTGIVAQNSSVLITDAGEIAGGALASSSLTIESTTGAGTSDSIIFKTGTQSTRWTLNTTGHSTICGGIRQSNS